MVNVNVRKLVCHNYLNDDVLISCTPIFLKKIGEEWKGDDNLKVTYAKDIVLSDVVIAYHNQQTNESYAYLIIKTERKRPNLLYKIDTAYLDEKLDERSIRSFLSNALGCLLYRDDITCQDYVEANGQYPFYFGHKDASVQSICNEVVNVWKVNTIGIESNPAFMDALKNIKEKFN